MRVLLTGATGFVGRQVLKALREAGADITATLRPGQVLAGVERLETTDLFAESSAFWEKAAHGHEAVIHLAWYAEPGLYLQSPRNLDCLTGTIRLAQGAMAAGVRHFQGIGTCFEYDLRAATGPIAPDAPLIPAAPYGAAKAAAYLALSRQALALAWSRLFYLHGEGEDSRRLVPYLHARLARGEPVELTSGTQVRDFLDVAEAGRQIAEVTLTGRTGPLNICSGVPVTVAALAYEIAGLYGRPDLIRLGARPDRADDPLYVVGRPSLKAHP